ncbi:MAG TPA: hypothetical protein VFI27_11765 [candidate division Zixibacteria bacterium]|nr:hypothetical protein [candidate division Zixibacteria bacterium]
MNQIRQSLPLALAYVFGALALIGLLFVPALAKTITGWVGFLAVIALLIGILNLFSVHSRRLVRGNIYSGVLVVSLVAMIGLGITDFIELTDGGVSAAFKYVQAPLEAAFASMLAFFLLFAGVRVIQRRRSWWAIIFITSLVIFLLGRTSLPGFLGEILGTVSDIMTLVFVSSGMRGILIGIALGAIAVSIRVLMGTDRPYNK